MKRKHLIAIFAGLAAIAVFTTDASAYYSPSRGRFLSRDPGPGGIASTVRVGTDGGFLPRDPISTINQPKADFARFQQVASTRNTGPVRIGVGVASQPPGRAIARGPISNTAYADGMNLYQYCRSNPAVYVDPLGLYSSNSDSGSNSGSGSGSDSGSGSEYTGAPSGGSMEDILNGPRSCGLVPIRRWSKRILAWVGKDTDENNQFRHCLWQCLLTHHCGEKWARFAGWGHELGRPDNADQRADLANNIIGRGLGEKACKPIDCYSGCRNAVKTGKTQSRGN